jgi:hypothetical protein
MTSQYHYSSTLPFYSDVWDPVVSKAPITSDKSQENVAPQVREPLSKDATEFLSRLPSHIKLTATARRYPHIVNKLSFVWNDSKALDAFLTNLLVDDRPNRMGFEFTALQELVEVRNTRLAQLRAFEKFSAR